MYCDDYFDLPKPLSILLALFPPLACLLGVITRFQDEAYLAALVRIFLGWNILWIIDIFCLLTNEEIFRFEFDSYYVDDYFDWPKWISVILALFPPAACVLGVITRACVDECYGAAILRLFLGWNVIWIADLYCLLTNEEILRVLD